MSAQLTPDQVDIIRGYLADGMAPADIAGSLQRMADLTDTETQHIRAAAEAMQAGEPTPNGVQ
ncbi:MAG: hypothetical protein L0H59_04335 [Tomitella sp.]|nr:hypothetical protein [Tomitella sp.]